MRRFRGADGVELVSIGLLVHNRGVGGRNVGFVMEIRERLEFL